MMVAIVGEYIQQETSVVKRKIAIKKNTDSHKRRVIQIRVGIRHTKSFIQKGLPGMRARQGLRRSKLPLESREAGLLGDFVKGEDFVVGDWLRPLDPTTAIADT